MTDKTHYFLAVRLPDATKVLLKKASESFQKTLSFGRWVHPEDLHITLAFLGFANESDLVAVQNSVPKFIENERSFSLTISHLGTFGRKEEPRIFWAGLNESGELQSLRNQVYLACERAGFQLEKRPFHPHITLARKWSNERPFHQKALEQNNIFIESPINFQVKEVVLYKTNLLQTPKYENLITFSLHL
ncbi:RNA 2',3'-cyclic phosphodiesterase [Pseudoneobacillus sp. C159]